ncbi:LysR family transcriptional regulator [Paraburkholderia sp. BL10I2N1]|uniref:LysR family transcriptional regulator n=1 Tax=Paraburkholderia sp. BL10I2N1 TaxID=1938796 RepID=UPI00105CFAAB|nr:LysR family transcriptional regulator [Paraburkholderia sp. BL10I2N1]TDN63246.1 DNA-binding transcriptional LysR family regulator [Paraburkholderia sp. BL10I2N1]
MDKIHHMRVFSRVVEAGSFTAVANVINSNVAHVSRAVSVLEDELRVRLFHRTTRRITLTDAGERYYRRCQQILADLDYADAEAGDALNEPYGTLRVHAMPGLGQTHLAACIVDYQKRYPNVNIELVLSSTMPRLVEEQFDVSVVTAQALPDSGYVSQVTGTSYSVLVAAPSYLEKHPPSRSPEDLERHACVRIQSPASPANDWQLESADSVLSISSTARFRVNDPEALRMALRAGAGIGALAVYSAIDDLRAGTLVRVLPQFQLPTRKVYSVYASRRYIDAKIRTFVDFLKDDLGARISSQESALNTRTHWIPTFRSRDSDELAGVSKHNGELVSLDGIPLDRAA